MSTVTMSGTSVAVAPAVAPSYNPIHNLRIKMYADGADQKGMLELYHNELIAGLTTNPTLMKKAGISDYAVFAKEILKVVRDKPISFEVFSDEPHEMGRQAMEIASWGKNVYVKIPITNTQGQLMTPLIRELAQQGVSLNVTALMTLRQVRDVADALAEDVPAVVSVFAGRIADTGVDPKPLMLASKALLREKPQAELLWASVREVFNILQAEACGCDIVTVPHDILAKAMTMGGRDLSVLSLETVRMFAADAASAGFVL